MTGLDGMRAQTSRCCAQNLSTTQKVLKATLAPLRRSITNALTPTPAPAVMTPMGAIADCATPRTNSITVATRTRNADRFNPAAAEDESPYYNELDSVVPYPPVLPLPLETNAEEAEEAEDGSSEPITPRSVDRSLPTAAVMSSEEQTRVEHFMASAK